MPRHSSKTPDLIIENRSERAIRVEKESLWQATKRIALDRRTQMICGLVLFTFAVVAAIAYVSFLFTGSADQSVLTMDRADRLEHRQEITNLLGLPGASLAQFMIDRLGSAACGSSPMAASSAWCSRSCRHFSLSHSSVLAVMRLQS